MSDGSSLHRSRRRFLACVGAAAAVAGCVAPADPRGSVDGTDDRREEGNGTDRETSGGTDRETADSTGGTRRVDVDGSWPMFGTDAGNRGYYEAGTADRSDPTLAWTSNVDGVYTLSAPVVDDGTLYTGSDLHVYAIDAEDGSRAWTSDVDHLAHHYPPAIDDGTVYVSTRSLEGQFSGGGSGALYAFDAANGEKRWHLEGPFSSPPTVVDGTVYVSKNFRTESEVVALDPAGEERWSVTVDEGTEQTNVVAAPAVRDDVLYVTVGTRGETADVTGGSLRALDRSDGAELWRAPTDDRVYASPVLVDDAVVVVDEEGAVRAVDPETGDERWVGDATERVRTTPATDGDGIYVHAQDHVVKLDADTGDREFKTEIGPTLINGIAAGEHSVYTGGTYVTSVDKDSGDHDWQYPVPAEFGGGFGAPVVLDGVVFVGACHKRENTSMYDDYMYALV